MAGVKGLFGQLGIPVYPLIGNHDHDRAVSDADTPSSSASGDPLETITTLCKKPKPNTV